MAEAQSNAPIKPTRLKQIVEDACESAIGNVQFYEHEKTEQWNTTIINATLKALIAESSSGVDGAPRYKFAVNSTIVQHLVPTSQLNKPQGTEPAAVATGTDGKPHVGRRGMHSAQAAFWNEKTDGMWTYKYNGDSKGLDVIVMVLWIAYDSGSRV